MKKLVTISTFGFLSLCADSHDQSLTFNVDNSNAKFFYQIDVTLQHQSTFDLDEQNAIILHALSTPRLENTYHHELGVGYRRMFEDFGFGTNILYANQYAFGIFNHNIVPGLELFYKDFHFAYNRYIPVKSVIQKSDVTYLFHDVSEISLSYRLWEKFQVGITPYFNHNTKRFGYRGIVGASVFDNLELSLTPYCEPRVQNGVIFSVTYHFRDITKKMNSPLSKSHRFFYTQNEKEVKKFTPKPSPIIMPTPIPVIINPTPPEEKKSWWEKFITINSSTSKK